MSTYFKPVFAVDGVAALAAVVKGAPALFAAAVAGMA